VTAGLPGYCRSGHPVVRAATRDAITTGAAAGVLLARIADQAGLSVHLMRRVVHG
jgi:hypothetical protein